MVYEMNHVIYICFNLDSHDVTEATKETPAAAILEFQTHPSGIELYFRADIFFCCCLNMWLLFWYFFSVYLSRVEKRGQS